jgi:hypothetical protein
MPAKLVYEGDGLDFIRDELLYSEGRMMADGDAADLAPQLSVLIVKNDQCQATQRECWRLETQAQARVDSVNYRLDRLVLRFEPVLRATILTHPQGQARYDRYFTYYPSAVVAMALEPELKVVRHWPTSLASEPETALQEYAPKFAALLSEGDLAIYDRLQAQNARRDHRVRNLAVYIDEVNKVRADIYAQLGTRVAPRNLPRGWPDGFFRVERRTARKANPRELHRTALLAIFAAKGLQPTAEQRQRLNEIEDPEILKLYLSRALQAPSIDDVFSE